MYSFWYRFRIFRQPQGHLLLIGVSGAGKTTLSRFVAWMNGLSVYQIKVGLRRLFIQQWVLVPARSSWGERANLPLSRQVHRKYTGEDFDEDLRTVLRRSGCKNEKIAFIMDESNVLDSGFLERMNTLLANGEVMQWPVALVAGPWWRHQDPSGMVLFIS